MKQQMLFQSNTNFKFIEAIDGSTNPETISLMKKYFDYMGIQNSSQTVTFDKSIMNSSYKNKYNFRRQHITKGSLGLIQSAFLLMNEFVKSDTDHILILEDDVYTMKHFHENLFINQELLKGKDLVYLGCHTSKHTIFSEKSDSIFIDIRNNEELIYGTYSIIISKQLAQYILSLGLDTILRLNLSWDLLLNYIRDTEKHRFTFFLYFKEVFIPNVIKKGGINPIKDVSFYTKNKIKLHDYYIPDVNNNHTENDIAHIMSTHNENLFFDFVTKAVYINLEDRVDRKEHAEQQLLKYIDSSKIFRFNAIRNAKGAVGCGLSHIAVLEMAIAEKWDNVFIAEDDILWTNEFQHGHDILESLIRRDYDVIVLGGTFIKSYKNSFKLISCNCALAYIVNKSYFQPLLQCFKDGIVELIKTDNQSKYAIDQAWKPLQRSDNWYIIKPNMCMQLPSYSNIENTFKDYTSYFDRLIEYTDSFNIDYFSNLNYHNKVFNPVETKPHETDDAYNSNNDTDWSKSVKVRNLRFEVNKETDRNTKPPEEIITIKPLNIAKRYFDYKEEPTIYSTEQFILNPPSFRKIFTFKSKGNKADNNKNYITRDNKSYSLKNIKFNIPEAPPSIPEPTLVSFKYLLNMLKMK
jgi:glycosyl transferase family 25